MKKCSKCGVEKDSSEFYKNSKHKDGLAAHCKICSQAVVKAWVAANPKRNAAIKAKWLEANPEKRKQVNDAWSKLNRSIHPDKVAASYKKWADKNRAAINTYKAGREAEKRSATPAWTNHEAVGEFYALAAIKSKLTGIKHHVDHQVPLKSKYVCGLHTHYNLQVLLGAENIAKGNRTWPDMWAKE